MYSKVMYTQYFVVAELILDEENRFLIVKCIVCLEVFVDLD